MTWLAWEAITNENRNFARFVKKLIGLRKKLKIFERRKFFTGHPQGKNGIKDITWYTERGDEFTEADWHNPQRKNIAYSVYAGGHYVMCIFNADFNEQNWTLPELEDNLNWTLLVDSSEKFNGTPSSGKTIRVPGWSVLVFEVKK